MLGKLGKQLGVEPPQPPAIQTLRLPIQTPIFVQRFKTINMASLSKFLYTDLLEFFM